MREFSDEELLPEMESDRVYHYPDGTCFSISARFPGKYATFCRAGEILGYRDSPIEAARFLLSLGKGPASFPPKAEPMPVILASFSSADLAHELIRRGPGGWSTDEGCIEVRKHPAPRVVNHD